MLLKEIIAIYNENQTKVIYSVTNYEDNNYHIITISL
jgi:hypothetical protein